LRDPVENLCGMHRSFSAFTLKTIRTFSTDIPASLLQTTEIAY
jgi:hypothetical protein